MSPERPLSPERGEPLTKISRLSAVVSLRASRGDGITFLGWDGKGLPVATNDPRRLEEEAILSYESNRMSGLPVTRLPYSEIIPVNYVYTGEAIDYVDQGGNRAEDLINYGVTDSQGNDHIISLGEFAILDAITDAENPWQDVSRAGAGQVAVGSNLMYTLFVPQKDNPQRAVAIMFKPLLDGGANDSVFRSFIRQSVGRLLILDESQEPERQKGYVKAAAKFAGVKTRGNIADALLILRSMGLADFDEQWLDVKRQKARNFLAGGLKVMKAMGFMEISDGDIEEIRRKTPDYDIESLDLTKLIELARTMRQVGRR